MEVNSYLGNRIKLSIRHSTQFYPERVRALKVIEIYES